MVEKGDIPLCEVLLADSGYDCKGNEEVAIFKPIRGGGCYKSKKELTFSSDGYSVIYRDYTVKDRQSKPLYQSSSVDSAIT